MAEAAVLPQAKPALRERDKVVVGAIVGGHSLTHFYNQGFLVIVPQIYDTLGLVPLQAGLIGAVQRGAGGAVSMVAGFAVDMFQHHRGVALGLSLALMGVGYMAITWVSNYGFILVGLAFASGGAALWHPPGLSVLSQRFPERKGFYISLHRSTGSVGDSISPVLVGGLLLVFTWQRVLQGALPIAILLAVLVWIVLWRVGGPKRTEEGFKSNLGRQLTSFKGSFRGTGLIPLLTVSALRGMSDRTILFFLPLYLAEELDMGTLAIGLHLALLTTLAIVFGPIFGSLSDRVGRKPVIVSVMLFSIVAPLLIVQSGDTLFLTVTVAILGAVMFTVNSLVQAAAMDIAEGKRLEGSFIGLLWGNNALFGSFSPIAAGALAGVFGFGVVFYYAAGFYVLGTVASFFLPKSSARLEPAAT